MAVSEDDFLTHIQVALVLRPDELAEELGLPIEDVLDRHGSRMSLSEIDTDPFWIKLSEYVDERIGQLMGVREELQRKMNLERRHRAEARKRVTER